MTSTNEEHTTVTRERIPEDQRLDFTAALFGTHFPLMIEPVIYGITERVAEAYSGSYWHFYGLDNDGFYMAPNSENVFQVSCDNYFTGELSADALGIAGCLYAYSHCSFSKDRVFGRLCADHYYRLRAYMFEHPEVASILRAID